MTLLLSIVTIEISFSAMKIIKNRLKNKIEAEFLASSMIIYIERDTLQENHALPTTIFIAKFLYLLINTMF